MFLDEFHRRHKCVKNVRLHFGYKKLFCRRDHFQTMEKNLIKTAYERSSKDPRIVQSVELCVQDVVEIFRSLYIEWTKLCIC